jgi:hypothetical protein
MNLQFLQSFSKSDTEIINSCRLFLQVSTLAEISDHQGTALLDCAFFGLLQDDNTSFLNTMSTSKLTWPFQQYPPRKAWTRWKKYLLQFTNTTRRINTPLGALNQHTHTQRTWFFVTNGKQVLKVRTSRARIYSQLPSRTRHKQRFDFTNEL